MTDPRGFDCPVEEEPCRDLRCRLDRCCERERQDSAARTEAATKDWRRAELQAAKFLNNLDRKKAQRKKGQM